MSVFKIKLHLFQGEGGESKTTRKASAVLCLSSLGDKIDRSTVLLSLDTGKGTTNFNVHGADLLFKYRNI